MNLNGIDFQDESLDIEDLSSSKNIFDIKLSKARPLGILGLVFIVSIGVYSFLQTVPSPSVVGFVITVLAFPSAGFAVMLSLSQKQAAEFHRYMMDVNVTEDYDATEAKRIAENVRNEVDPNVLREKKVGKAPLDRLDEDEKLEYYLMGFDLDIDGNDEGFKSHLMVTDKKVVMIATSITGKRSQYTVSYHDIIGLSVQRRFTSHIRVQTAGHSYKISASGSPPELADEVVEYIRKRKDELDGNKQNIDRLGSIDKLEKLAELQDKGILTQDEFEKKKQSLVEDF